MKPELMIPVEQAVRPLPASHTRKMRMRQELYELIEQRYQSSLDEGQSESQAIDRAIRAFGDPAVIRAELRQTIPVAERLDRRLSAAFSPETFPLSWRQSSQLGLTLGLPYLGVMIVLEGILLLLQHHNALLVMDVLFTLPLLFGVNVFQMSWTASRAVLAVEQRRWTGVLGWSVLSGFGAALSVAILYFIASPEYLTQSGWKNAVAAIPASVLPYLLVCFQLSRQRTESAAWDRLEIPA